MRTMEVEPPAIGNTRGCTAATLGAARVHACVHTCMASTQARRGAYLAFILHPSPASHETRTSSRKNSLHLHARTSAGACPAHALL